MHPCRACNKPFNRRVARNSHERCHVIPTYRCQHCERAFRLPRDLEKHLRTHDPESPRLFCPVATCPQSQTGYTTKGNLMIHVLSKHPQVSTKSSSDQALGGTSVPEITDNDHGDDNDDQEEPAGAIAAAEASQDAVDNIRQQLARFKDYNGERAASQPTPGQFQQNQALHGGLGPAMPLFSGSGYMQSAYSQRDSDFGSTLSPFNSQPSSGGLQSADTYPTIVGGYIPNAATTYGGASVNSYALPNPASAFHWHQSQLTWQDSSRIPKSLLPQSDSSTTTSTQPYERPTSAFLKHIMNDHGDILEDLGK